MSSASVPLWLTVVSSLLSGLVGVFVSAYYYRRYERRKLKLDTLRRLLAYRHATVVGSSQTVQEHFFAALNEVFVIFHDSPNVIRALQSLHADLVRPERLQDNVVTLFKVICSDLKISHAAVNDSFFLRPFVPGPGIVQKQ